MSVNQLLFPNDYNLFCNSITSKQGSVTDSATGIVGLQTNTAIPSDLSQTINWNITIQALPQGITLNNGVFTIINKGLYSISLVLTWFTNNSQTSNQNGFRLVQLVINNNPTTGTNNFILPIRYDPAPGNTLFYSNSLNTTYQFNQGDTFSFQVFQNSGSSANVIGHAQFTNDYSRVIITELN